MAAVTTVTELDGNFKRIYADRINTLVPENAKIAKEVKFYQRKRLGDTYEQPAVLALEQGGTYAAAGEGAFTLNAPIAMTMKNARVPSSQFLLRSRMDYETASKATSGGDRAFRRSVEVMVMAMMRSVTHRLECSLIYGGTGLGQISSTANASATSTVATISDATWAMGIWAGAENAQVDIYESGGQVGTGSFTITSVDIDNKTLTLTGTAADITILDADANGTGVGLDIYWKGSYGKDMNGIDKIITNTGSLFGINAGTYNLWKGNTYAIGGALTVTKLLKSTTTAIGKGALDETVNVYISPQNFAVLNAEVGAYRRLDSSYKTTETAMGTSKLQFYAQNGLMTVMPHSMVKAGEGFIMPIRCLKRIGSTDTTFNNPSNNNKFFKELEDAAGFELRCYYDQASFIDEPAKCTKLTGITY